MAKESDLVIQVKHYLDSRYPEVPYKFDSLAGIKLPIGLAVKARRLGNTRAWPDLFVAYPVAPYNGLFLELKREGERIRKVKTPAEYASAHIAEQAETLQRLSILGYFASFSVGYGQTIDFVKSYLAGKLLKWREIL